jgi:hypothetical protein
LSLAAAARVRRANSVERTSAPVVGSRNLMDTAKAYCLLGNARGFARVG